MKKYVFILMAFCLVATTMYAQNESFLKERVAVPEKSFVFNLGYNFPIISNTLTNSDFWNKSMGTEIEFGVDFRKQFRIKAMEDDDVVLTPTLFAMGIGLGISYFHQSASFKNFSDSLPGYTDVDGDDCDVKWDYQGGEESVSLAYLDIPLYLEIGKPSRVKTSAYLKLGVKASVLVSDKFSGKGTYTATGYYSKWNVTLYDIPRLGYLTNAACYDNPEYKLSPFVLWGNISGGISIPLSNLEKSKLAMWILRIGAKVDYTLTPISKALQAPDFTGQAYLLNQSNMLGGDGSRIFSFGLSAGFIYCFN